MKIKQGVSILLLAALLSGCNASSSSETEPSEVPADRNEPVVGNDAENAAEEENPSDAEPETARLTADLPEDLNYGGETVFIMQHPFIGGSWADWLSRDLWSEGFNGEPINDAVYSRNIYVEDRLNVRLDVQDVVNMPNAIRQQVNAGTADYNISSGRIADMSSVVLDGYLLDLYDMPHIDLTKPWYDQKCIDEASFYGLLYYVTGDMLILDDDSTGALVFNKQLITDYNLDMPYDLVEEGTWTMDKMGDMARVVATDLNGNGEVDLQADRFGILWQRDAVISFMHGCEVRLVDKDPDGEPVFVIGSERAVNMFDKMDAIFFDPVVVQNIHNYEGIIPGDLYVAEANVFREDNVLFMWIRMRVAENLRDMETDFGIIPVPKLDEIQKNYYSTITRATAATVCIPNCSAIDWDVTGAVVELMSAVGHYDLREAYYEINLGTKVSRDPQSTEMLSLIMNNRVYDAGEIYNIGSFSDQLFGATQGTSIGLATRLAKSQKLMDRMLKTNFVDKFKTLAEQKGKN